MTNFNSYARLHAVQVGEMTLPQLHISLHLIFFLS